MLGLIGCFGHKETLLLSIFTVKASESPNEFIAKMADAMRMETKLLLSRASFTLSQPDFPMLTSV